MTTNNHPANGPVSLDRLHQIREILSKAAAQSDGGNLGYAMADAVKVIDGVIAAFDAEPVGYFYAEKPGDWYQISDGDKVPVHRRIPLYSSPQSGQVVKLPNEFISNEGIVVQIEKVMAVLAVAGIQYERKGNACRAAMLQAGNSPVIPDGYALVPVEPTDEMIAAAMNCEDVLFNSDESFCVQFGNIYEAMLAAAPQHEVK
ncbi:hypothetical protein KD728_001086 [Salmonella enterica subsp. enterica serovar Carrau]|nr:hypothetical protein [Salmonella enterica]EDN0013754.1 hypothetical protein [Salmonella enterica subsp. enterica serovar Poona]EDP2032966.1 hypothetical protein [Salmonella enterica subsp. enterica serovar Carrau]EBJ8425229.1 hypothetical protein [Salmonella enterica]EBK9711218.1 hypothetical protein [Salmonella enterica]